MCSVFFIHTIMPYAYGRCPESACDLVLCLRPRVSHCGVTTRYTSAGSHPRGRIRISTSHFPWPACTPLLKRQSPSFLITRMADV